MLTLTRDDVRLGCRATDWRAALEQAAEALVEAGRVSVEYREGLLAREAQSSTYLGHGIAIPHGTLGSDPQAIPVLVGLGVDELSVSSRRVPLVKAAVRELTLPRARELAELALRQPTAVAVREALEVA
jgi:hypothetical protein